MGAKSYCSTPNPFSEVWASEINSIFMQFLYVCILDLANHVFFFGLD